MNKTEAALLSPAGVTILVAYLALLLALGFIGRQARRDNTLADFYLAGRSMGLLTLFLTLYATQYSGNNLVGFAAKAYRSGFDFFASVSFMLGIIAVYWLFAPPLRALARKHAYITPGDYLYHRYRSRILVTVLNLIFIVVLASYILTNLKAMGYVVETATAGHIPFAAGIAVLSLLMVVYETLGGMRSVAWTDAMQGVILLLGCIVILVAIEHQYQGIETITSKLYQTRPEFWNPPALSDQISWFSLLVLVSFGAAIYPQAIQRIYAAKNARTLKRSLQFMLIMPWLTTFLVFLFGVVGAIRFPDLDAIGSEHIALMLLNELGENVPLLKYMLIIFIAAVIAAIMSTVDSALLAISSLFTQDIYRPLAPHRDQSSLTRSGKLFSWIIMGLMALAAVYLPQTIWKITVLKLELLIQAAPAMLLGVSRYRPAAGALLCGILSGIFITVLLKFSADFGVDWPDKPFGIHAGIWGLLVNAGMTATVHVTGKRNATAIEQSNKTPGRTKP